MSNKRKSNELEKAIGDCKAVIEGLKELDEESLKILAWRGFSKFLTSLKEEQKKKQEGESPKKLSQYSWEEIASFAEDGKAAEMFEIGDEKEFELYTGEKLTAVILDFNHDDKADGSGKAGITFGLKDIPDGWYEMNAEYTNEGGWAKSKMRNVYMQRYFKLLPNELRKIIKPVIKRTSIGGAKSTIASSSDLLFLFSEIEVFGEREYSCEDEGEQYPYFVQESNRVKKRGSSALIWWLRSPYYGNSNYFCYVHSYGHVGNGYASFSYGAVFGFCL